MLFTQGHGIGEGEARIATVKEEILDITDGGVGKYLLFDGHQLLEAELFSLVFLLRAAVLLEWVDLNPLNFDSPVDDAFEALEVLGQAIPFATVIGFDRIVANVMFKIGRELHAKLGKKDITAWIFPGKKAFDICDSGHDILKAAWLQFGFPYLVIVVQELNKLMPF
jgi:hypothetical protein